METFNLVPLSEADIPQIIHLSDLMGWDYTEEEARVVLKSGLAFGHKTEAGQLISSAAIFPYGNELASIGMVMVNPNYQRLGLGQSVTQKCIDSVSAHKPPIMLVATPKGQLLYEKVGFRDVDTIYKFICNRYVPCEFAIPLLEQNTSIQMDVIRESDFDEIVRLDANAVGAERKHFLSERIRQAKDGIVLRKADKTPVGYGLCIQNPNLLVLGPIVAPSADLAARIVHHFATKHQGPLRIDVPAEQEKLRNYLLQCGFENVTQPPVMLFNAEELPERNHTLFAIAAQAFG